ncbi:MAG: phosphoenolpyruvate--protein phosphotransferase [Rickettsiales bacterium]|nr:phosphoenolpyruvate--protein phosphotransferase [Rickettsiales bacterium]
MTELKAVKTSMTPFALMREVRDVMRSSEKAQKRLNRLVKVIASGFESEVCSIYFARNGQSLELYATQGLNKEAVHKTTLAFGEGLVGEIASLSHSLNLPEAHTHAKYAYKKETGEEKFHSFVGVPILYNQQVIGVLVVQSTDSKIYSEEQLEILQTVAMVLAELAIACQVVALEDVINTRDSSELSQYHTGLKISPGLAQEEAVLHRPKLEITRFVSDNPEEEEARLQKAIRELQESVEQIIHNTGFSSGDAKLEIIETYRMFTHDKGWLERIIEAIQTGLTAEAAVKKVQEQMHARMMQTASGYMRERMMDLEELSSRLQYHLAGVSTTAAHADLPNAFILIAKSMGPAELLEYSNQKNLKGVILEEGSASSHLAIIARMMDIPMVARIPDVTQQVQSHDTVIVDGDNGEIYIRPPKDVSKAILAHIESKRARAAEYDAMQDLHAETQDGVDVSLNLNIGLHLDAAQLNRKDVDGIGLYRTELPYLASSDIPDVDEQRRMYHEIFKQAEGKPIIFRSFDIGGDKSVPYVQAGHEENPAMGWRATRIGLDRPVILRRQFRALIRAAGGQALYVMFPFIANIAELEETRAIFDREVDRAKVEGQTLPSAIHIGSMIEIPSILYQLPALLKQVDFVSIGSNDLLQFLYACDRGSDHLSGRYDPLSPTFLGIIRSIVEQCNASDTAVGFCGDMASRPLEALGLLGCGVRSISIPPASIGPVKSMIRNVNMAELKKTVTKLLKQPDTSIRNYLEEFVKEHSIEW